MLLGWFSAREATELGVAFADKYPLPSIGAPQRAKQLTAHERAVRQHLQRAAQDVRTQHLNFYKRAQLANSFKWRLLERGLDQRTADSATQALVLSLSLHRHSSGEPHESAPARRVDVRTLLAHGDAALRQGAYDEAAGHYEQLLALKPRRVDVLNKLGSALYGLGRLAEAQKYFRAAIGQKPNDPDAHGNLGAIHLARGYLEEAESSLRHALKLRPGDVDVRSNLGLTLVALGRLDSAQAQFERVLRVAPRHANARYGMGIAKRAQGRFEEAGACFKRALEVEPTMARAWAALASIRRMDSGDGDWLKKTQQLADGTRVPLDEVVLRFALGKYFDDNGRFEDAFRSYQRGNDLLKPITTPYEREERTRLVDELIRTYTAETIARVGAGGTSSRRPVFVVGMMRSGTSLAEQILASHPEVAGAGELEFWNAVMRRPAGSQGGLLDELERQHLASEYLRILEAHSPQAARIIDKAPLNSDCLGLIFSVFPNARIIYMRRDPIDTCLSCYFQRFGTAVNFALDLGDLAHYYREHQRLIAHWRAVLPAGSLLEVPYEGLVANQEQWTRRMLDFVGLEWSSRCLEFHNTERTVLTTSFWQVRQKIYNDSVRRSRHYRKFIGPLLDLQAD